MGPRVGSGLPFLVKKRFPADGPSRRGSCYAEKQEKRLSPFSRARRPSCPAPFGTRPGLRHVGNPDRPPFGWTRHPLAEVFLRASLVADHTAPHPGGGAAPSCARGRPFCSGGVGGCSASVRRPSSRSRSRSFARWPFPIRKAALPWGRAAFIIFLRDACLAGRWPDAPPGPGAGKIRREKRRSRGCRASLRTVRAGCPGGRGDWTPGRFGRATPPCSKTA